MTNEEKKQVLEIRHLFLKLLKRAGEEGMRFEEMDQFKRAYNDMVAKTLGEIA